MRYAALLPLMFLGLTGCVVTSPTPATSTTYVTPAPSTAYVASAPAATVVTPVPPPTTTVIRTP